MAQGSMDSDRLSSAGISTHSSATVGNGVGSVIGVNAGDVKNEEDYNLGPLPPMWEKAFTPSGEVYFIDHNTGTSHWLDPRLARVRKHSLGECGEDELPYGWERVSDERYGSYYVDHINRRTQYENPVLQARRMRNDKPENSGGPNHSNVGPPGELQGERFSLTLTKGTQGLGFTLIGAEGVPEMEGYLQIRSIVPHSPAWVDGALRPGDVLVGVGARGVRGLSHAQQAQIFQSIPPNSDVTLHLVRGYPLAFDSGDPHTRVLSTRAVGSSSPTPHDARAMQNLTRALRTRFNLESRVDSSPGLDEPDSSPAPPSPTQRRLMSRSFDLDELGTASEETIVPPRCPSADHLLSLTADPARAPISNETGRELVLSLRRGNAGFGFTIADSVHGQKVKKVLDRSRCAGLREGDLLLQIGESDVRHAPHQHVVQVLKDCPALHETIIRVWRRNNAVGRAPRSRSATRPQNTTTTNNNNLSRSKTPTAEQLRSQTLHAHELHDRLNGMNTVEATYAVPEHKRESLIERRRRNSTPGGHLTVPIVKPYNEQPDQTQWRDNEPWLDNSTNVRNWADNNRDWNGNAQKWNQNGDQSQSWNQNGDQTRNWNQNGDQGQNWGQNGDLTQKWGQNGDHGQNWGHNGDHGQNWGQNGDHGQNWGQNGAQGQKWTQNGQGPSQQWNDNDGQGQKWNGAGWSGGETSKWGLNGNWNEVPTPTVNVDMNAAYWRGNASVADSSDNGGFPEDGLLHSPTTAALSVMASHRQSPANGRLRAHSPNNSGRLRSNSPSLASTTDRLLGNSPTTRMRSQSPSNNSSNDRIKGSPMRLRAESPPSSRLQSGARRSPSCYETDSLQNNNMYPGNYTQPPSVPDSEPPPDPQADVCVRIVRGPSGFGFRIVGGTEDGSRLAIGHVVPGGPAAGLLRAGDLLTSVDGCGLTSCDATHARAVALVCRAAANGHVTLGIRHNRGDVQPLGLPARSHHPHQAMLNDPSMQHAPQAAYNILHPAPVYPPVQHSGPGYPVQYEGRWQSVPYDVTLQRCDTEGFGFVVISSTNKATTSIGQIIPNSPAARCGLLHVGDTILAINHIPIRNLPHPELVGLIKHSGTTLTLTLDNNHNQ